MSQGKYAAALPPNTASRMSQGKYATALTPNTSSYLFEPYGVPAIQAPTSLFRRFALSVPDKSAKLAGSSEAKFATDVVSGLISCFVGSFTFSTIFAELFTSPGTDGSIMLPAWSK